MQRLVRAAGTACRPLAEAAPFSGGIFAQRALPGRCGADAGAVSHSPFARGAQGLRFATAAAAAETQGRAASNRGIPIWLLGFPAVVCAGLGTWQLQRKGWKEELLRNVAARIHQPAVSLKDLDSTPEEFTRVRVRGRVRHDTTALVGPRPRTIDGRTRIGYTVVAAMDDADSGVSLLVNRGWVPADVAQDPARKGEWQPAGVVEVEGLVRGSEDPGRSGVANDVGAQQWHYIDVPLLAQAMGLHESTPMVEVVREGGYVEERPNTGMGALKGRTGRDAGGERGDMSLPVVRAPEAFESHAVMPVDHLGYAFTWFGLSVSAIGMAAVHRYARSRRSRLKGGPMGLGKRPTFRV